VAALMSQTDGVSVTEGRWAREIIGLVWAGARERRGLAWATQRSGGLCFAVAASGKGCLPSELRRL